MERVRLNVGLVLFVCIGTVQSQMEEPAASVLVNDPMKVKPGQQVVLNCVGSRSAISFYIRNRVEWSVKNTDGMVIPLTNSYGPVEEANPLFDKFKYSPVHHKTRISVNFELIIADIQYSDDGEYTCSIYDENYKVINNQTTSITVVSPVRNLTLELHDSERIVASSQRFTEGTNAVEVPPAKYKVTCISDGSNPQPKMSLFYNQDQVYVVQKDTKVTTGPGPTYKSTFDVEMLKLSSMNSEQLLMCESNIAGDYFQPKMAGINLLVKIVKPEFRCANLYTAPGERNRKLSCDIVAKQGDEAPMCKNVMWKFGDTGNFKENKSNMKYTDPNKEFKIMESECSPIEDGVKVTLNFYTVTAKHMETTFYVVYGVGSDAEQYPIQIYLKETSAGSMPTPVTILFSLLMAFVSRHIARSL